MKRVISVVAVIALTSSLIPKPVKANPAVLAPVAFCAGTAGVGCVIVGTVAIGGVIYYVWQASNGKRVHANSQGRIMRSDYLQDPEYEGEVWDEPIYARNKDAAQKQCQRLAKQYKVQLQGVSHNGKSFICTFKA